MDSKEKEENSSEIKHIEGTEYLGFADKHDPSDDNGNDSDPEDTDDQLWIPDDEDEGDEDDYDENDNY